MRYISNDLEDTVYCDSIETPTNNTVNNPKCDIYNLMNKHPIITTAIAIIMGLVIVFGMSYILAHYTSNRINPNEMSNPIEN